MSYEILVGNYMVGLPKVMHKTTVVTMEEEAVVIVLNELSTPNIMIVIRRFHPCQQRRCKL